MNIIMLVLSIIQLVITYMLAKLVADFLNKFRVGDKEIDNKRLASGDNAPLFRALDIYGNTIKLTDNNGGYTLLFFSNNSCGICKQTLPRLVNYLDTENLRIIVIVSKVTDRKDWEYNNLIVIESNDVFENYYISIVPNVVILSPEMVVLSSTPLSSPNDIDVIIEDKIKPINRLSNIV